VYIEAQNSVLEPIDYWHMKRSNAVCIDSTRAIHSIDSLVFTSTTINNTP